MAIANLPWVMEELFQEAKALHSSLISGYIWIANLDNQKKNTSLEDYRAVDQYASLEVNIIDKRIAKASTSAAKMQLKLLKAATLDKLQALEQEVNSSLRVIGFSLLSDFPIEPITPSPSSEKFSMAVDDQPPGAQPSSNKKQHKNSDTDGWQTV